MKTSAVSAIFALSLAVSPKAGIAAPAIDVTRPVENLAHDPDAQAPANPRNLLTSRYDRKWLEAHLAPGTAWLPYPTVEDRARWDALPTELRKAIHDSADAVKDKPWEPLTATMALSYLRNGNRSEFGARFSERQTRLQKMLLAELCEGQGRLLDPIADAIWIISEETFWGQPVHIPQLQRSGPGLPNVEEPTIDISAPERGAALAWTSALLGARLDTVSPFLRTRIHAEIDRRILTPFLERNDFFWMGLAERKDLNNWTPWILSNVLTCALLTEENPARRAAIVEKSVQVLDRYLNLYPADGGCDEGPHYWDAAAGATFDCLELLSAATKGSLSVYDDPLILKMGRFIADSHVAGDWTLNFGDGSARDRPGASLVYRYGKKIGDPVLQSFGGWLARREKPTDALTGNLGRQLPALFVRDELSHAPTAEPLPRDIYLPDLQLIAAREKAGDTRGLYFAIRGYFNAKSHNHNDAGSFMLYLDGQPILIDVGVETYTTKTFSAQRYEIWTMQSAYHNLPTINGQMESWGHRFHVDNVKCRATDAEVVAEMNLAPAYPAEAAVESWTRKIDFVRGEKIALTESYRLTAAKAPSVLNFMTACRVDAAAPGKLLLITNGETPVTAEISYDPAQLTPQIEEIPTTDRSLQPVWGSVVRRIQFTEQKPTISGTLAVEFRKR
jgi:hypothetical protein